MLFTKRCAAAGIEVSIGSVGDCYDNAVCETFHASLKKERIYRQSWPNRAQPRAAVFEYIEGCTTRGAGTPRSATSPRPNTRGGMRVDITCRRSARAVELHNARVTCVTLLVGECTIT